MWSLGKRKHVDGHSQEWHKSLKYFALDADDVWMVRLRDGVEKVNDKLAIRDIELDEANHPVLTLAPVIDICAVSHFASCA